MNSAGLAVFRIAFGIAMMVNALLYAPVLAYQYYIDTDVQFPYGPLLFVPSLPGPGIYVVYAGIFVTGALIALGRWYRPAVATLFVLATYVFLLDSSFYQNHEYLVSMLAFLMFFLPLDQRWSLDARRHPERASATSPAWVLWLLRFQIGVPYFYGGLAKLNGDWLQGEPLRRWLAARTDVEPMATILTTEAVVWFMAYGALVLDLAIVWLLLYRRTRVAGFVVITCFHLLNVWLFGLFIFPWLMIAATTLFFEPDWPERLGRRIPQSRRPTFWPFPGRLDDTVGPPPDRAARRLPSVAAVLLLVWASLQVTLPFRHYAIDGDPSWTEQGHRFAWHMKLRDKQGTATMLVDTPDGTLRIDPRDHLGTKQAVRLAGHPDRLAHFARYLSDLHGGVPVRAETSVSLNGRAPQPIVDPLVDLSSVPRFEFGRSPWIADLVEPLPRS